MIKMLDEVKNADLIANFLSDANIMRGAEITMDIVDDCLGDLTDLQKAKVCSLIGHMNGELADQAEQTTDLGALGMIDVGALYVASSFNITASILFNRRVQDLSDVILEDEEVGFDNLRS